MRHSKPLPRGYSKKVKLYKVLSVSLDGTLRSCSGGDFIWSPPRDGKPSKWHHFGNKGFDGSRGGVRICERGLHVIPAHKVADWFSNIGNRVFEVDVDGRYHCEDRLDNSPKLAVERCRLRRMLSFGETKKLLSGSHWLHSLTEHERTHWRDGLKASAKKTTRAKKRPKKL